MGIEPLREVICKLCEKLGFEVEREVPAFSSAWVDVVWFDKRFRFPKPKSKETLLRVPKLPVVGFEIEYKTAINPKHVKGSITNLDDPCILNSTPEWSAMSIRRSPYSLISIGKRDTSF
jgi:hypothetical protein